MQGVPSDEKGRTRLRVRAQGTQGEDLSWQLEKSGRLPEGGGARQDLEDPGGGVRSSQAWAGRMDSPSTSRLPGLEQTSGTEDGEWEVGVQIPALTHPAVTMRPLWALGSLASKIGQRNDAHRCRVWCAAEGAGSGVCSCLKNVPISGLS